MSVLAAASAIAGIAKTGYDIWQNEREYNSQSDATEWNKKYQAFMAWQQQQNRADDIRRSDRILAENRAREDSAWQRAVADIQKAGLSTTMLSGGASSGATATNVGSGASNGGGVHSGVRAGKISGVDFGALVEMKKQEQEIENAKETNELIKAQKNYYNSLKVKTDADAKNTDVRTEGQVITNNQEALRLADGQYNVSEGRTYDGKVSSGAYEMKSGIPLIGGAIDSMVNNIVRGVETYHRKHYNKSHR